jgi:hypothetical protein
MKQQRGDEKRRMEQSIVDIVSDIPTDGPSAKTSIQVCGRSERLH